MTPRSLVVPVLFFLVLCAGCSCSSIKSNLEASLKEEIEKQQGIAIDSIKLLKNSPNKYSGIVKARNGASFDIQVTVDGDDFMWRLE